MPAISEKRLKQIIAEELESIKKEASESLDVIPVISKKAVSLLNAIKSFKEECPESCMHSIGDGLTKLETTLDDMAKFPGNYASFRPSVSVRSDVDSLHTKK